MNHLPKLTRGTERVRGGETMNERLNKAEVIKVIHVSIARGEGSESNPVRYVDQYWSFSGELLAENDPLND